MPENPPGLTLNSVPFPGLLASIELREAYRQYKLELAKRPPPEPPAPIEPGPSLYDVIKDGLNNMYRVGLEEGRKAEQEAKHCKMRGVVADDAALFGKHRETGLSAKKARLEVIKDLIKDGVVPKTAENRATAARHYWEDNLATK
jgi:hypothetical protein